MVHASQLRSPRWQVGAHILIWALILVSLAIFTTEPPDAHVPHQFFLVTNIYHIALFYFNALWLFPRWFNRKYWWLYFFSLGVIIVLSYQAKMLFLYHTFGVWAPFHSFGSRVAFFPPVPFLVASFVYAIIARQRQNEKREKDQKAERLSAELKFLRNQVNPHFLFNMMTNMVSLARQKSDLLEAALMKLSDLLRYMLYETGEQKVTILQEIEYLQAYVDLQKLRFGADGNIRIRLENDGGECRIEPMLLVPFLENAFKHGMGLTEHPFIDISLRVDQKKLVFKVVNNYSRQNASKDRSSGIGLANVRARLNLLYPKKYELVTGDVNQIYSVSLNIILS